MAATRWTHRKDKRHLFPFAELASRRSCITESYNETRVDRQAHLDGRLGEITCHCRSDDTHACNVMKVDVATKSSINGC